MPQADIEQQLSTVPCMSSYRDSSNKKMTTCVAIPFSLLNALALCNIFLEGVSITQIDYLIKRKNLFTEGIG